VGREIERRFFVQEGFHPSSLSDSIIDCKQPYLRKCGDWVIRARHEVMPDGSDKYTLTLKSSVSDVESKEINIPTTLEGYVDFASECLEPIKKQRYLIPHGDLTFEVDVFTDPDFAGLIIAEIELPSKDTPFILPDWLGEEITSRKGFSNYALFRKMHGIYKK
jgi:CYTH domain-containing protein